MLADIDQARADYHAAMVADYGKDFADKVIRKLKPLERPVAHVTKSILAMIRETRDAGDVAWMNDCKGQMTMRYKLPPECVNVHQALAPR